MQTYEGNIKYNDDLECYGFVGPDGNWIKEKIEDGGRIDVVINGELFETNFITEYPYRPVLKPHVWSNWEFLTEIPAIYYDFGRLDNVEDDDISSEDESKVHRMSALLMIGSSLLVSALFGGLIALIASIDFFAAFEGLFWFLGAPIAAGGIMCLLGIVPVNYCIGFSCALYYGTILLARFLSGFIYTSDANRYFISSIIVALVCYIVWLKKFKPTSDT